MGYCEPLCQFCGVSFAISRSRRKDEPYSAAWNYTGAGYNEQYEPIEMSCGPDSGCEAEVHYGEQNPEHVVGPFCGNTDAGYSGHQISMEEMKGCRAIQCLMRKGPRWQPEFDDQDFELNGNYFLSSVGDGSPDEAPLEIINRARHKADSILVSNVCYTEVNNLDQGLPFHPTCFEIFKIVSNKRLGMIDVHGLWTYWYKINQGAYHPFFTDFPRSVAARMGNEQFWAHQRGCEYLVANPIHIPNLPFLLGPENVKIYEQSNDVTFNYFAEVKNGNDSTHASSRSRKDDPFAKLPRELSHMLLSKLSSKDIANLRHVSRTFRNLPRLLFRQLLFEEMPWLWEVENYDAGKTDWFRLYKMVKFCWLQLKGLKNRQRIWTDVEEVVRRIAVSRENGKIVDEVPDAYLVS